MKTRARFIPLASESPNPELSAIFATTPTNSASLAEQALALLSKAATVPVTEQTRLVEERNVWQPHSWLIQRCWEALADQGAGEEALTVANLLLARHPLAPLQAIYRLAQRLEDQPALGPLVQTELTRRQAALFRLQPAFTPLEINNQVDRLLLMAASAGLVGDVVLAAACLEQLDQFEKSWERIFPHAERRTLLAKSVASIGLHPLTTVLITSCLRRFEEAGAHFLHEITTIIAHRFAQETASPMTVRLLLRCLDTFRHASLVSLQSRRIAATVFAQAGLVDELLNQVTTIANVQSAQRATGYSAHKDDPSLLRQVKRASADKDVDLLISTLRAAVEVLPMRRLTREQRIALADQLAVLGVRSDGWTAAGAAAKLIELGAYKYAIEVVERIAPNDPTRSEGMLTLVRGLLAMGEGQLAAEQTQRALAWVRSLRERNPERALTWGLAAAYLDNQQPAMALQLLEQWRETPLGFWERLRRRWRPQLDDDGLRISSLRLRSLLQPENGTDHPKESAQRSREIQLQLRTLYTWAPQLLEGEALINFYVESLLQPLLNSELQQDAWDLLPSVLAALANTSGNKHALRVAQVATLLERQIQLEALHLDEAHTPSPQGLSNLSGRRPKTAAALTPLRTVASQFLFSLWQSSTQRGLWQTVHSLEGSLSLLFALEGPSALVVLARGAMT